MPNLFPYWPEANALLRDQKRAADRSAAMESRPPARIGFEYLDRIALATAKKYLDRRPPPMPGVFIHPDACSTESNSIKSFASDIECAALDSAKVTPPRLVLFNPRDEAERPAGKADRHDLVELNEFARWLAKTFAWARDTRPIVEDEAQPTPMKKTAIVKKLERDWPGISNDLKRVSKAKPGTPHEALKQANVKHGYWVFEQVRDWGVKHGRLPLRSAAVAQSWHPTA